MQSSVVSPPSSDGLPLAHCKGAGAEGPKSIQDKGLGVHQSENKRTEN